MGEMKSVPVDGELLREAEALGVDAAALLETQLRRQVETARRARQWAEENRSFIDSYNRYIDDNGTVGEEYRQYG